MQHSTSGSFFARQHAFAEPRSDTLIRRNKVMTDDSGHNHHRSPELSQHEAVLMFLLQRSLLVALVFTSSVGAQQISKDEEAYIERVMQEHYKPGEPGAVILVAMNGKPVFAKHMVWPIFNSKLQTRRSMYFVLNQCRNSLPPSACCNSFSKQSSHSTMTSKNICLGMTLTGEQSPSGICFPIRAESRVIRQNQILGKSPLLTEG